MTKSDIDKLADVEAMNDMRGYEAKDDHFMSSAAIKHLIDSATPSIDLTNYVQTSTLTDYAKKSDIKEVDLSGYRKLDDLSWSTIINYEIMHDNLKRCRVKDWNPGSDGPIYFKYMYDYKEYMGKTSDSDPTKFIVSEDYEYPPNVSSIFINVSSNSGSHSYWAEMKITSGGYEDATITAAWREINDELAMKSYVKQLEARIAALESKA